MTGATSADGADAAGARVVVADDDEGARALLVRALTDAGFLVTEAHDGLELLDVLTTVPSGFFELVISDQRMPRLHGLEVMSRTASRAPFILFSGYDIGTLGATAARLGATAVLRKPLDIPALIEIVERTIAERRSSALPH
jgi:DNA-binding NtrC family response regulator